MVLGFMTVWTSSAAAFLIVAALPGKALVVQIDQYGRFFTDPTNIENTVTASFVAPDGVLHTSSSVSFLLSAPDSDGEKTATMTISVPVIPSVTRQQTLDCRLSATGMTSDGIQQGIIAIVFEPPLEAAVKYQSSLEGTQAGGDSINVEISDLILVGSAVQLYIEFDGTTIPCTVRKTRTMSTNSYQLQFQTPSVVHQLPVACTAVHCVMCHVL